MTPNAIQQPSAVRAATDEEIEAVEWATEIRRKQLGILGEALQRLVVLETAVLSGSAALLNQIPIPSGCKTLAVIFMLIALALSLLGAGPVSANYALNCPEEIIAARQSAARWRKILLRFSGLLLFMAFAVIVGGLLGAHWGTTSTDH
jgi:hypothetical protein